MDSPQSGSAGGVGTGSLSMPSIDVEVQVSAPPKIAYYWVLKQNIDRLRDALEDERADRRLELIFGFSGLAIGTAPDFVATLVDAWSDSSPASLNVVFSILFGISAFLAFYFWKFVKPTSAAANRILDDIVEKEYGANVTRATSESGRGATGGQTGAVRQGEPGGSK